MVSESSGILLHKKIKSFDIVTLSALTGFMCGELANKVIPNRFTALRKTASVFTWATLPVLIHNIFCYYTFNATRKEIEQKKWQELALRYGVDACISYFEKLIQSLHTHAYLNKDVLQEALKIAKEQKVSILTKRINNYKVSLFHLNRLLLHYLLSIFYTNIKYIGVNIYHGGDYEKATVYRVSRDKLFAF